MLEKLELCPFEAFGDVLTGSSLARSQGSPVGMAYRIYTEGGMLRASWDPGTVACTVLGPHASLHWSDPGLLTVDDRGVTRLQSSPEGNCRILLRHGTAESAARWIEELLSRTEDTMQAAMALLK